MRGELMNILARISVILAVIVICAVGLKFGYAEYSRREVSAAATGVFTAPPYTVTSSKSESNGKISPPEKLILHSPEESKGSPAGSTDESPNFTNSVFVGDSVSLGFSRFCAKSGKLTDTVFLTAGSYSVSFALSSDKSENKGFSHPIYKGKEAPLRESLAEIKPENVFICLGINDIAFSGVDGTVKNYCKLINTIREICPEAHIYIVSTTFMLETAQKTNLNNLNLANLNCNMKQICTENEGLDYIDVMSALQDEKFALAEKYCSDGFIHQTNSAYAVWLEKLGVE